MNHIYYYSDGTTSSSVDTSKTLHREDGPAIEYSDGEKVWCINGKLHREDGPAVDDPDGTRKWYINDKRHREDGPAVEDADGYRAWYVDGEHLATLTKEHLIKYMELNNLTITHLLTDSDEIVRTSATKCDWSIE